MDLTHQHPILVVYNPSAGKIKSLSQELVSTYLEEFCIPYRWITLDNLKHLALHFGSHHYVLIIGGDGTLNTIINAIGPEALHRFTFGIIPTGTGNDFARSLNIPLDIGKAFQAVASGHTTAVDIGVINNGVCFTCATSLGFGPEVTKYATRRLRKLFGRWALYWGALQYFFHPKQPHKLKVRLDQKKPKSMSILQLVIGNAKYHGGGFPIAPQSDLQNARFSLYYLKPINIWRLFRLMIQICKHRGETMFEELTYKQASEITIQLPQPMEVDVDGDIYLFKEDLHITIRPRALRVLMPHPDSLNDEPIQNPAWKLMRGKRHAG